MKRLLIAWAAIAALIFVAAFVASAQITPNGLERSPADDIAAFKGANSITYEICWTDDGTADAVEISRVDLDNFVELGYGLIYRPNWTTTPDLPGYSCATVVSPETGRWEYQVRACAVPDPDLISCTNWSVSTSVLAAVVDGQPQGWYIIIFEAAPEPSLVGYVKGNGERPVYGVKESGARSNIIISWVLSGTPCNCDDTIDGLNRFGTGFCSVEGAIDARSGVPIPERELDPPVFGAYAGCSVPK